MKKKDAYSSMSFWLPSVSANNFFLTTKKTSVTVEGLKINCHGQKEQEDLHRVAKVSGPQERAWSLKIAYTGFGHKKQVLLKKKRLLSQFLIVSLLWTPVRTTSLSNSVEGNDQLRVAQSELQISHDRCFLLNKAFWQSIILLQKKGIFFSFWYEPLLT